MKNLKTDIKNNTRMQAILLQQNLELLSDCNNELTQYESILEKDAKKLDSLDPELNSEDYMVYSDRVAFSNQNIAILNETIAQVNLNLDEMGFSEEEIQTLLKKQESSLK